MRHAAVEDVLSAIEARLAEPRAQHLLASWEAWRDGQLASPMVIDRGLLDQLAAFDEPDSSVRGVLVYWLLAHSWIESRSTVTIRRRDFLEAAPAQRAAAFASLVEARNREARGLGWPDYPALALRHLGVDAVAEQVSPLPARPEPEPGPGSGELEVALGFLAARGLDRGEARIDLSPVAPGPRSFAIDPPVDLRVVTKAPSSDFAWRALCHELGHIWCWRQLGARADAGAGWAARLPLRAVSEAVAEWIADAADGEAFGCEVLKLTPGEARRRARRRQIARQRYGVLQLLRARFELLAYREPLADPGRQWSELLAEVTGSPGPEVPSPLADDRLALDPCSQAVYAWAEVKRARLQRAVGSAAELDAGKLALLSRRMTGAGVTGPDRV